MATQITPFSAIPDKDGDSVTLFQSHVSTFTSELPSFRSSVNTIAGEMNSDRTKVVDTNSGLIAADLDTVEAAQFSPATIQESATFIERGTYSFTVQTGKNLAAGMRVTLFPALYPTDVAIKATVISYTSGTGELSITCDRVIGNYTTPYSNWLIYPSAPDTDLDFLYTYSDTSVAIGTGSKTFTVELGKDFVPGMWVIITTGQYYLWGVVTSYTSSTGVLVVNVTESSDTTVVGTIWELNLTHPPGSTRSMGVSQAYGSESRALDTWYQNTSLKPILVMATFGSVGLPGARVSSYIFVKESSSGAQLSMAYKVFEPTGAEAVLTPSWTLMTVVPPNHWYMLFTYNPTIIYVDSCYELK